MMKYKIWSVEFSRFVNESEWFMSPKGEIFFEDVMEGGLIKAPEDKYKVFAYTGLHDLYGQEIYEGDLVSLYYHHENITVDLFEIRYGVGRWMLDDWACLSKYYLDKTPKFGDVCRVVKIGHTLEKRLD